MYIPKHIMLSAATNTLTIDTIVDLDVVGNTYCTCIGTCTSLRSLWSVCWEDTWKKRMGKLLR